jgi:hypothetical protein
MGDDEMETTRASYDTKPPTQRPDPVLEELRALRQEQRQLRRVLDEFCGSFLRARFPYGDGLAGDRWSRRR